MNPYFRPHKPVMGVLPTEDPAIPVCVTSNQNGIYAPSVFCSSIDISQFVIPEGCGVRADDIVFVSKWDSGGDLQDLHDEWDAITTHCKVMDVWGRLSFIHENDGDIWCIPVGMEWDDEEDWFVWPKYTSAKSAGCAFEDTILDSAGNVVVRTFVDKNGNLLTGKLLAALNTEGTLSGISDSSQPTGAALSAIKEVIDVLRAVVAYQDPVHEITVPALQRAIKKANLLIAKYGNR